MNDLLFLDIDDVIALHADQLAEFGGADGLRDRNLLDSAIAQPQASFGGHYVHDGLFAMAAAYLFHIVSNHPFVDGNKRTGLLAALVFLDINGTTIEQSSDELYELTMSVANGQIQKADVTAALACIASVV